MLAAGAARAVHRAAPRAARPHIVTIIVDDLGFDDTQLYNTEAFFTPQLGKLKVEGIMLQRHHVFMWCSPTRRSFLTGRLPAHIGSDNPQVCSNDQMLMVTCPAGLPADDCIPLCEAHTHGFLLLLNIDGTDTTLTCSLSDLLYSWVGAAALGGYLGRDVNAFVSAVISGAAGTYMLTLTDDANVVTHLTIQPGQTVIINGDAGLTEAPSWGTGGFSVEHFGLLKLTHLQIDGMLSVVCGATIESCGSLLMDESTGHQPCELGLNAFKFSTGTSWPSSSWGHAGISYDNWGHTTVCSWSGVTCDANGIVTELDLSDMVNGNHPAPQLAGNIGLLALECTLTVLDLTTTSVFGDIAGLAPLTRLAHLRVHETSVTGDVHGLAPLTQLTYLDLGSSGVSGDVAGLATLTHLTYLNLRGTSVSGDVAGLVTLTQLAHFYVSSSQDGGRISDDMAGFMVGKHGNGRRLIDVAVHRQSDRYLRRELM